MKKLLAAALILLVYISHAYAQAQYITVTTCGAQTLPVSQQGAGYMDLTGNICTNSSGGGTAGAVTAVSGAYATGSIADIYNGAIAPWDSLSTPAGTYTLMNGIASVYEAALLPAKITNNPVGTGGYSTGQVNVTSGATLIVGALAGAIGTGRVCVTITNLGTTTVWLGSTSGVTSSTGEPLAGVQYASVTRCTTSAIYGISGGATQTVAYGQTF